MPPTTPHCSTSPLWYQTRVNVRQRRQQANVGGDTARESVAGDVKVTVSNAGDKRTTTPHTSASVSTCTVRPRSFRNQYLKLVSCHSDVGGLPPSPTLFEPISSSLHHTRHNKLTMALVLGNFTGIAHNRLGHPAAAPYVNEWSADMPAGSAPVNPLLFRLQELEHGTTTRESRTMGVMPTSAGNKRGCNRSNDARQLQGDYTIV